MKLEGRTVEREAVVLAGDAERLAETARPRAEQRCVIEPPTGPHTGDAVSRLERAEKHGGASPLVAANDVGAPVDPVRAIDVQVPGWPEHRRVPPRPPTIRVARRVVRRVRLGLDDDAADAVHEEQRSDQAARDHVHVLREERAVESGGSRRGYGHASLARTEQAKDAGRANIREYWPD